MIKKVDANQKEIVAALRKIGCSVFSLAMVGKGLPDLLIGLSGKNYIIEIKDGKKSLSRQKLSLSQQKFLKEWNGQKAVVTSINEALKVVLKNRSK